jgi:hypothetical protein
MTPPNPYVVLAVVLVGVASLAGSFAAGYVVRGWKEGNAAGAAVVKTEAAEDTRDTNIEAIGTAASTAAATAHANTKGAADASAETIRTVYLPASACRDVDPVVVREHSTAVDRINAKVRGDLRPGATGRDRAATND